MSGFGQTDYRAGIPVVAGVPFYNPADPEAQNPLTKDFRGGYRQQVEQAAFAGDRPVPQAQGVQLGYVPQAQTAVAPAAQLNYGAMAPGLGVTAGALSDAQGTRELQRLNLAPLADAAAGRVPSAAERLMQAGLQTGLRQSLALAASASGTGANQVAARRAAIDANTAQAMQTRGQTAQLRAAEQAEARTALTNALTGIRAQDQAGAGLGVQLTGQGLQAATAQLGSDTQTNLANLGAATQTGIANMQTGAQLATAQLGADQAVQLANLEAALKSRGLDDAARLDYLGKLIGIDTTTAEGMLQVQQLLVNAGIETQRINAGIATGNAQVGPQLLGAGLGALGSVGAAALGGGG